MRFMEASLIRKGDNNVTPAAQIHSPLASPSRYTAPEYLFFSPDDARTYFFQPHTIMWNIVVHEDDMGVHMSLMIPDTKMALLYAARLMGYETSIDHFRTNLTAFGISPRVLGISPNMTSPDPTVRARKLLDIDPHSRWNVLLCVKRKSWLVQLLRTRLLSPVGHPVL